MDLSNYKRCLTLRYDEFIAENKMLITSVDENVAYEKITGVTCVRLSNNESFFLNTEHQS